MRTPGEAIAEILGRIRPLAGQERVPLEQAAGRVLAGAVSSDVDLPPFEKSAMDGYAVRAADFTGASPRTLVPLGESRAGAPFAGALEPGGCVAIFTGAELPRGADAVVMVEDTQAEGTAAVRFPASVRVGQNVEHRAAILARGAPVMAPGRRLSAADLAVLAAVGADPLPVVRRPRVSILTTGDELVAPSERPGPGQIREGNTYYLRAAAAAAGCELLRVGRVPDDRERLRAAFGEALDAGDALITSGGVSVGKYDLVAEALESLGVEPVLHKVAIKPGKPIWFGLRGAVPVFGLPGNPVSSMLGFRVFVRPALARLGGETGGRAAERAGRWAGKPVAPNSREQNFPCRVVQAADGIDELVPLPWRGSADMVGVAEAEAFAVVPAESALAPGERVLYRPLPQAT